MAGGGRLCAGVGEAKLMLAGISQESVFASVSGLVIGEQEGILNLI